MDSLATFDVFDTALTRALGEPRAVGYVLGRRLRRDGVVDVAPEVFVAAHQEAERLAYRRHGERRTLVHGCTELARLLGLGEDAVPVLVAAEETVELDLARPVPARVAALHELRAAGTPVAFLSDTGLSGHQVEAMLRRVGAMVDGDRLWVSNELGAEKGTGRAFHALARELAAQPGGVPGDWQHAGDNERSDVLMARASGVAATLLPAGKLTGFERSLDRAAPASEGVASALAGASRRTRLVHDADPGGVAPERVPVVAGVLAPLLAGLALRALTTADARGLAVRVAGPGAPALAAVLEPLAAALHPGAVVHVGAVGTAVGTGGTGTGGGSDELLVTAGLVTAPAAGPSLHLGVIGAAAPGPAGGAVGYLVDGPAGTGASGSELAPLELAAALAAGAAPGDLRVLRTFAAELAGVLPELDHRLDVRSAVTASLARLWERPDAAQARTWAPGAAGPVWPAARAVLAPAPVRALARAAAPVRAARPKLARARQLLADRWSARRR